MLPWFDDDVSSTSKLPLVPLVLSWTAMPCMVHGAHGDGGERLVPIPTYRRRVVTKTCLAVISYYGRRRPRGTVLRRSKGPPPEARSQDGIVAQGSGPAPQPLPQLCRGRRRREGRREFSFVIWAASLYLMFMSSTSCVWSSLPRFSPMLCRSNHPNPPQYMYVGDDARILRR